MFRWPWSKSQADQPQEEESNTGKEKLMKSFLGGGQVQPQSTVSPEVAANAASRLEAIRTRQEALGTRETTVVQKEAEIDGTIAADNAVLDERETNIVAHETAVNTSEYRKDEISAVETREHDLKQRETAVNEREVNIQTRIKQDEEQLTEGEEAVGTREQTVTALEAQLGPEEETPAQEQS